MAKSILDIIIKLTKQGGADKETVKDFVSLKRSILDAAAVGGSLVATGYAIKKVFDATVGTLISYADQVRRIDNATGMGAESASKLIQILDDQKISFEELEKAVAKNGKTFDFSVEGIARMSDEYLKLTSSNEQAAFMQERFGKNWISFVPIMKQGRDAILASADAVDQNLVLTEKAILATRRWEIQMDNFNDKIQGMKISLGQQFLGLLDGSTEEIMKNAQAIFKAANGYEFNTNMAKRYTQAQRDAWEEAKAQAEQEWLKTNALNNSAEATDAAAQSAEEYAKALEMASKANQDMLGLIGKVASQEQSYAESSKQIADERLEIEAERAAAIQAGWPEASEKIKEFDAALEENGIKAQENADKHHEAMARIQYDLLLTKLSVNGLTDAEFQVAQQAGLMFGVFDEGSVRAAEQMNAVANAVANGTIKLQDMDRVLQMMKKGYSIDVVLRVFESFTQQSSAAIRMDKNKQPGRTYSGYAGGGISTGPASGHWELLHGTEAVIPLENGSVPVQMQGGGSSMAGGGNTYITLTISSPLTIMDEQKAQTVLLPMIVDGVKKAQAQGWLRR